MKKITRGTGITERDINVFENQEEQKADAYACIELFSKHENWFERYIFMDGIETWVQQVTKDYVNKTGKVEGEMKYETIVEEDSELQYALGTRSLIRRIRSAIERDDIDEAVQFSLQLGEKLTEIRFKFNWEKQALMGVSHSESQSEKGIKGADVRWSGDDRKALADIVNKLAKRKDAIGDYEPPNELWTLLYSQLEDKGLCPIEHPSDRKTDASYNYGADKELIIYKTFCKQIERARKK